MRKKKLDKSIFLLAIILILVSGMVVLGYLYLRPDILTVTMKKGQPVKILFIFSDKDMVRFMELFLYHPGQKKGGVFHIPENLGTKIEHIDRMDKISVLYKPDKITPLKRKVEQIADTDIPFYIDLKIGNISRLIDLLEGIELYISNPVVTGYKGKKILLPSGIVFLDGDKVEDYILYEEVNEEERDKVWRKQKFLQSLLKRIGEPEVNAFLQHDTAFNRFYHEIETNISKRDFLAFIKEMAEFDSEHMYPARVEGKLYLIEDKELLFPHLKGEYLKLNIKQLLETISSSEVFDNEELNVTLEILNGTEVNGLAGRTAHLYQGYGYEVVTVGNADHHDYVSTIVLDRKGRLDIAEKVAEIIQCERVRTEIKNTELESTDVTIILGRDFDGTACKK
jgi:anionic cell wall polymer biosynthesis LytR-Cps2A-Psr (LCP) family protein